MVKDLCFEIIEACPNECKFCSSNSCIDKKQIISFNDFKRVIDYFISEGGIEELSLSGGEPFLHPDLFKMIEYVKSFGIKTVIFTCGIKKTIVSEETKQLYLEEMKRKLDEIEQNEPWNERLKNNGENPYFEELLDRIRDIRSSEKIFWRKVLDIYATSIDYKHCCLLESLINASIVGIETDVHFIPMKPNYKEIPEILELLEIANINNISILNFVPQGRGLNNISELMLNAQEQQEFMELLSSSRHLYNGNIRIGIPLMEDSTHQCNAGLEKLDIKFDGTILPCPAFKELDVETMKKYKIKCYSIYENLEAVKTPGGKRVEALCKKVYKKYQ